MLRQSSNLTGWNELLLFLQVTSFFWICYLDSVIFTTSTIAYFSDEFYSSEAAVFGTLFLVYLIFIEYAVQRILATFGPISSTQK